MITTTRYSQRDAKWGNIYMGSTYKKIKDFGCTITSLCNLLNSIGYIETPKSVNEKLTKAGGYIGALLIWSVPQRIWGKLQFVKRSYNYNNVDVAWYIYGKKLLVLVEVNGAKIGGTRHWVLFIGSGKMVDPWDGQIKPTNHYPLTGYTLYNKV